jgi:hypothetical protein
VPGVTGLAFTVLFGMAIPEVFPGDRGTDPRPGAGKMADGVWGLSAYRYGRIDRYAAYRWPYR